MKNLLTKLKFMFIANTIVKLFLIAALVNLNLSIFGQNQNHTQSNSYYAHLYEVNKEWLHHKEICPEKNISFQSDQDRIQLHLKLVIAHLKSNAPTNLNTSQQNNRKHLLDSLQKYCDNKVFPVNKYHSNRQPYFVDEIGTNCAVAHLIYSSGHESLVNQISKEHNYDYIKDIDTKGLKEWAIHHGFTLDELKWIQPGYSPAPTIEQVQDGPNGEVKKVSFNFQNNSLVIAGKFTELNTLPCLNVGVYKNNQLACLGNGIDGIINDVINNFGTTYVFGELHHNGQIYPAAKFENSNWTYLNIPNRTGAISYCGNTSSAQYQFEIAISHSSIPGKQEVWHYLNNNTWQKKMQVNGIILDLANSGYGRIYAGHFDSVISYNPNAMIDTMLMVHNVVINPHHTTNWYGLGNEVSDTVKVVANIGNAIVFGGACSNQMDASNICLSRYFNATLQPLFINTTTTQNFSVNSIAYDNGTSFYFGGDFYISPMVGYFGRNLASFNLMYSSMEPIAFFDQPVNSISYLNDLLFIGGMFEINETSVGTQNIRYLAKQISAVGIAERPIDNLNIHPNPFRNTLIIEGLANDVSFAITNIQGSLIKQGRTINNKIESLDFLSRGTYLIHLYTPNGNIVKKVIK